MQLEDIFLARYAELDSDGMFTVVGGGVKRINVGGFPWAWGLMFLLAQIRLTREEAQGEHTQAVDRETPDGQVEPIVEEAPMLRMPPAAEVGPDGRLGLTVSAPLINLVFPKPGVYKYRFKIDGQVVGVAELLVAGPAQGEQAE